MRAAIFASYRMEYNNIGLCRLKKQALLKMQKTTDIVKKCHMKIIAQKLSALKEDLKKINIL